jgi:L-xylulokinase
MGDLRKRRQEVSAFLGIDAGNTGVKAVLFDDAGRTMASAHRDTGGHSPAPGMVERDIGRLRTDLDELVRELLGKSGLKGSDIAGIGTSGHGNGLYLLDDTGEPVAAIQSLDTRAAGLVEDWNGRGVAATAQAICLQRPWAAQTPALLAWMAAHRPETMARAAHLLMCKDLVTHALTGEMAGDVSDMGGAGLLRLPDIAYDDALLQAYGLEEAKGLLPKLHWPTDVVGSVTEAAAGRTGLAAGTPVVAGFFDVLASAVGAGVTKPGQASLILGTWSINQAVVETPAEGVFMSAPLAPGRFMSMENSATSATNLEWLAHNLLAHDRRSEKGPFALADALASMAPPKPDGPLYHPYLYGASGDASARAGWFGLAGWHDGADMLRALFEGVAFAHLAHIEQLEARGVDAGDITLSGGGAKSPLWPQMIADMRGRPVKVAAQAETGALGAAMAAVVGTGRYRDIDKAAEAMVAPPAIVTPNPGLKDFYQRRFALWRAVEASLSPHWAALRTLGDG